MNTTTLGIDLAKKHISVHLGLVKKEPLGTAS